MSLNHYLPKKLEFKPQRHHGFHFLLWIIGMLMPPIAIAMRFGVGTDLFVNIILTICGYIPGHLHNFYCQNIRNNTNRGRTPKWAIKAGLIDTADTERRARKNQWSKRFEERNNQSTHVGQDLAEGEVGDNYVPVSAEDQETRDRRRNEGLWQPDEDEEYYNPDEAPNQRHWHYPANFEGAATGTGRKQVGSKNQGDRWERTRASRGDSFSSGSSYPAAASADNDVPEWGRDYGSKTRRSAKNKKKTNGTAYNFDSGRDAGRNNTYADDVARDDGWGGGGGNQQAQKQRSGDMFDHEF